jgi:hypothetical protein
VQAITKPRISSRKKVIIKDSRTTALEDKYGGKKRGLPLPNRVILHPKILGEVPTLYFTDIDIGAQRPDLEKNKRTTTRVRT